MKNAIITGVMAATILIAGCGKKSPSISTTPPPAQADAASSPASHPVLAAWQQGDKAAAVTNFLATDWSIRPLFASGSILSLSEDQLKALSAADRKTQADKMMPQLLIFRDLVEAVEQVGKDAASKGDTAQARKCFVSLKQCGTALDSPDYTLLVRQIGQAIQKLSDKDSTQLGL
jgi:hypothetical protein